MQFAPSLVEKLRSQARRFLDLTELISTPEVATDGRRLPVLLQERGSLQSSADLARRLEELVARRGEAERILAEREPDPELAALAREDLEAIEPLEAALDREIKEALIAEIGRAHV